MQTLISAFLYASLAALICVVFAVAFPRLHPLVDLFAQFLLAAIVGAALIAVFAALIGRPVIAAAAGVVLLAALALGWPWLQAPSAGAADGPRFTLMTFNVYYYNRSLDRAVALIRAKRPDILVLLEVIPEVRPGLSALETDYPYRVECWRERPCDALIFSRFPLTDISVELPEPTFRRPLGAVRTEIEGRPLTVFAAHLSLPYPLDPRARQPGEIEAISTAIASIQGPRVMSGDFNAATWGATMSALRERTGMEILTGVGGTWPTFLPRHLGIPIDHVMASDDLVMRTREVINVPGSDHRAVVTEIAFKK